MTSAEIVEILNTIQNARNEFVNISVIHSHDNVSYILYDGIFIFFDNDKFDFINYKGNIILACDINRKVMNTFFNMIFR